MRGVFVREHVRTMRKLCVTCVNLNVLDVINARRAHVPFLLTNIFTFQPKRRKWDEVKRRSCELGVTPALSIKCVSEINHESIINILTPEVAAGFS